MIVSKDGLVYICDRVNDRIQVFHKDGTFVKEVFVEPKTLRSGSVWDMEFSRDPQQTYIYAANGVNEKINILLQQFAASSYLFSATAGGPDSFWLPQPGHGLKRKSVRNGDLYRSSCAALHFQGSRAGGARPGRGSPGRAIA